MIIQLGDEPISLRIMFNCLHDSEIIDLELDLP